MASERDVSKYIETGQLNNYNIDNYKSKHEHDEIFLKDDSSEMNLRETLKEEKLNDDDKEIHYSYPEIEKYE